MYSARVSGITRGVPPLIGLAAHPVRWALMRELAVSDRRVRELVASVGQPQNLVSYHLRVLRSAGLVVARRSSFDGRDSYYHLDLARCAQAFSDAATALHPGLGASVPRRAGGSVLFVCTGNSVRSPMAEALLRHRVEGIEVASAGSHPADRVHPAVARVLHEEFGIGFTPRAPQSLAKLLSDRRFEHVITLCDKVREFARAQGVPVAAHWSLPAPSLDPGQRGYRELHSLAIELDSRIRYLSLQGVSEETP
ncbi:ArsR family transcriptional regulator [Nocardia cyriacigeorgica]|nr:ArsR family transcriptional regulator [Nocardia cyriacigeorgica]